jgi:hypothetical protein
MCHFSCLKCNQQENSYSSCIECNKNYILVEGLCQCPDYYEENKSNNSCESK